MKLKDEVRQDIRNAVLCWLASVDEYGHPNVSPKQVWSDHGENALIIADIASPVSVRNIRNAPHVCVSFIDIFRQKGWKIAGTARIIAREDPEFTAVGKPLLDAVGDEFPIRHIIHVEISRITRVLAPSFSLYPDRSEEESLQRTYETYGVQPIGRRRS